MKLVNSLSMVLHLLFASFCLAKSRAIFFFMFFSVLCIGNTYAQSSREYIRQQIKYQGNCRNVAITKTGGDLMLYGRNGCARQGCPQSLNEAITELNKEAELIDDVQLTENGRWLILYGNNGFRWNDIPYSLENKLREYNDDNEVVLCATFNDYGNWVVISTEHFSASDTKVQDWLREGMEDYGGVLTVCLTNDSVVAVYQGGYKFAGNVPETLKSALRKTSIDVYRLKIAGDSWFFADMEGNYQYNM